MGKIDFVILWVDGNEPNWQREFQAHSLKERGAKSSVRFRDWDNLQYWFRGVENYAPWVNNIFFITSGHVPNWLNLNAPNLKVINHSDYIPNDILPTFSSNTIEMYLHKIEELSEHFVLFNDDFFIINHVDKDRFFKKKFPCDISAFNVYHGRDLSTNNMCNIELLNKHFDKRKSLKKHFFKWFSIQNNKLLIRTLLLLPWPDFVGFYDHHLPQPFLKSTFKEVWEKEGDAISQSIKYRFRQRTNITQYLVRYWQLASGKYHCTNVFKDSVYFQIDQDNLNLAVNTIRNQSKKIIVLNDKENIDFENSKELINLAFSDILPLKSKFEI
ncbi:stealth family protein [Flavobacterium gilvum]|uniref:Glycosyl transferase n=1 Tax=Flavobacterium gilvum TaxID=1492737 RepID=A0AAC9I9G6_9FLAO|nr:stealth family protein [Flavobacterium gilvum]AOW11042.1 hypothetical protein EM308_16975 [Flavobacterium gilvum]KFC57987.1 hypothetical protein FEM08_32260 [Flavobacterium gilvum]